MRILFSLITAVGISGALTNAAIAQDTPDPNTLSCADYLAMEDTSKLDAFEILANAALTESGAEAPDEAATETYMQAVNEACSADPALTALDALKGAMEQ